MRPLADEIRPQALDQVAGQKHLLGPGALLRRLIEGGTSANMIFYGPSGTGKTTIASIIAKRTEKALYHLNATTASLQDVKAIIADVDTMLAPNGVLLYLDEIQYFNKKQQQSLLEFMENGKITLIASTTENPYFYVYNALLSRSTVFEFKALTAEETLPAVLRALDIVRSRSPLPLTWEEEVPGLIAAGCGGDVRKAVNAVELLDRAARPVDGGLRITAADAAQASQRSAMRYDREGDEHYDLLSALQKSIRGSDPDAAVYYLGRPAVPLPAAAGHRRRGRGAGLSPGHGRYQGLRGRRPGAGPAGGQTASGGGGHSAGHGSQVQLRPQRHHRRHGRHPPGQGGSGAPAPAERPRRQHRQRQGPGLQIPPRLPPPLCGPAVSAGGPGGRDLLPIRRQQDRTGRPAVLGGYQEKLTGRAGSQWT